jgi:hypothetical protein
MFNQKLSCFFVIAFWQSLVGNVLSAQEANRWQQKVEYQMNISMDVKKHQFTGTQQLTYHNNSPDKLTKLFYHLYFNAFQPNSAMDIRNQYLEDSDKRVGGRISKLKPTEIGYLNVKSLKCNGQDLKFQTSGTILEVTLNEPIAPNSKVVLNMEFDGQVPLQIRRSGRDNAEGISYSMTQWYPKLCEYDYQGWHANPYIGREFYGVWGDYDVTINIDKSYMIGGTGVLQNPEQIGHGYTEKKSLKLEKSKKELSWNFKAQNVHDFAWAADPDYVHDIVQVPNGGPTLHFFYENKEDLKANWKKMQEYMVKAYPFIKEHYGEYPYPVYSFIQGGDGGMEYPMCTLITGKRSISSLVGVAVHEWMHTWYQMLLATNESLYAWMDEGFTTYASAEVMSFLFDSKNNPQADSYEGYYALANSGKEEPLSTHADHFNTNFGYGLAAYSKGSVFLNQLGYVIGQKNLNEGLLKYYNAWRFKHPNINDFIRIMELQSDLELDWYKEYFVNSTHTIDYGIDSVSTVGKNTKIFLHRIGKMPMPIDVLVEYNDGKKEVLYIPLELMRGEKVEEPELYPDIKRKNLADWEWVNPYYKISLPTDIKSIKSIVIDPTKRLADIEQTNNTWEGN